MLWPIDDDNALVAYGRGAKGEPGDVSEAELDAAIAAVRGGVEGASDTLQKLLTKINLRAPLASPAFTGSPTAPTQSAGNDSTKLSTTAFVQQELTNKVAVLQPLDNTLTALAALTVAANKIIYSTGTDVFTTADITAFARTVLAAVDAAAALTILGAEDTANKGNANGYAGLDNAGKVPASQLPASVTGAMAYQGTWNASTNTPTMPAAASGNKGYYYKVSTAGTTTVDGINDWQIGDWIVSNGTTWDKIDNTDLVSSVAGLVGIISAASLKTALSLVKGDVGLGNVDNTSDSTKNAAAVTLSNKTIDNTNVANLKDTNFVLQDDGDATKQARFQLSGIATATLRTYAFPDVSVTLAGLETAQVFSARQTVSRNAASLTAATNDVAHFGAADSVSGHIPFDSFAAPFVLEGRRASGTAASKTTLGNTQLIFSISGGGYNGAGYVTSASMAFETTEAWTNIANGSKVVFETTPNGSTTPVRRFEIGHDGTLKFNAYGAGLLSTDGTGTVIPTSDPTGLGSINSGPLAGLRNRFLNGCMRVNQRGVSTAADGDYCFDRWYVLTETGNVGITRRTDFATGTPSAIRLTQPDASPKRMALCQVLTSENGLDLRGKTITASFRGKLSSTGNIRMAVLEWLGTEDVVTKDWVNTWSSTTYTGGNFFKLTDTYVNAVSSSLAFTSATARSASLSATISNTANNIAVMIWTEGTQAQNVTLDLTEIQLEIGSTASAFERRPAEMERNLCRAYFQSYGGKSAYEQFTSGQCNNATTLYCRMPLVPVMRASPSLSYSSLSDLAISYHSGGAVAPNSLTIGQDSDSGPFMIATCASSVLGPGDNAGLGANNTTNARLNFSAEI